MYLFRNDNVWWVADYSASEKPSILGCNVIAWQYTENSHNYAFNHGDLDVNILFDEERFFIENYVPFSDTQVIEDKDILTLQRELNNQGFTDKNFNSLVEDGIAGELTLSACPMLRIGSSGLITQWIQLQIGTTSDGLFGEQTRQAVIEYQENRSLDGDGIVGKNTWRKLLGV